MIEIIIFAVLAFLTYKLWKAFAPYRISLADTCIAFSGGLGSGKSFFSVRAFRKTYLKNLKMVKKHNRKWKNRKNQLELPKAYSSIAVKLTRKQWAEKLTPEILLLQERIPDYSVVFLDEIGSFCNQFEYKAVNADKLDEFVRLYRHYTRGGKLICNDQCSENIVLQVRRRLNNVYNLQKFRTFFCFYWVRCRNICISEEIKTVEDENLEDGYRLVIGFFNPFRRYYDTHCYHARYELLPLAAENPHGSFAQTELLKMPKNRLIDQIEVALRKQENATKTPVVTVPYSIPVAALQNLSKPAEREENASADADSTSDT